MDGILLMAIFRPSFIQKAHLAVSLLNKNRKAMENRYANLPLFY